MERKINIRRFSREGSTTTPTVLEEAERVLEAHLSHGGLVVNEDTNELISSLALNVESVLLVDPIIGG